MTLLGALPPLLVDALGARPARGGEAEQAGDYEAASADRRGNWAAHRCER
jgi:hypothetical protein